VPDLATWTIEVPSPRVEPTPRWVRVCAGEAEVADALHRDVVWTYTEPVPECPRIAGLAAFFNEKVDLVIDGVRQQRPRTPWSS
jgi:uncharacterized protein (DUF427 family)